ncbi:MAG: carboxymuconolactone decarboxylase family protein, partial [Bacteroidetes bacterium]|nr:carboxymuconolactone decarboxylase family protein [Bacteroidota bacterium]
MAHIGIIAEENAGDVLRDLYRRYRAPWGGMDNILAIHSQLPETLPPHVALYKQLMFAQGPLSRRHRELIATVVSAANRCDYCIHHHSDALDRVTRDRALVRTV